MGGRRVELYVPFKHNNKWVKSIDLAPLTLGHTMRWQKGEYHDSIAMLTEIAGVAPEVIQGLRYPDADRVLHTFLEMLPQEVRDDVINNQLPQPAGAGEEMRPDVGTTIEPQEPVPDAGPEPPQMTAEEIAKQFDPKNPWPKEVQSNPGDIPDRKALAQTLGIDLD